jgi:hypothetical protein
MTQHDFNRRARAAKVDMMREMEAQAAADPEQSRDTRPIERPCAPRQWISSCQSAASPPARRRRTI